MSSPEVDPAVAQVASRPVPDAGQGALESDVASTWAAAVARHADRRCLYTSGGELTYRTFDRWSAHVGAALRALGVGRGTRVALAAPNSARHLAIMLGVSRLGAVMVPLDSTLTTPELVDLLQRSEVELLVADSAWVTRLAAERIPSTLRVVDQEVFAADPPEPSATPELVSPTLSSDEPWAIMYTSGSTSKPRGVVIPQRTFAITGRAMRDALDYRSDDTIGSVLPIHHASVTLMSWAPAVMTGATFALEARFSRSGFWDFVRRSGTSVMTTVPTIIEILLTAPTAEDERSHPLRLVATHRGIPEFTKRFGVEIRALWGMTETGGLGCVRRPGDSCESIGRPYPPDAEPRLVGPDGSEVPDGEVGELWFRHAGVMSGYLGEHDLPGGWVVTGDLMVRREDGELVYVGRSKNMIKRGGENISLEEIERTLIEHPAVDEVAVIAVPDPIYVEEACAVVVWSGDQPRVEDLRAYCAKRLAPWKQPRYIYSWTGLLPELANHKIDRRAVAAGIDLAAADEIRRPQR